MIKQIRLPLRISFNAASLPFLLTVLFLIVFQSATISQSAKKHISEENIVVTAWNESKSNSYKFIITRDKKFYYTIQYDTAKTALQYSGKISLHKNTDTLFLKYDNNKPLHHREYLIFEVSGNYLVQWIDDRTKPVFLRMQQIGFRF